MPQRCPQCGCEVSPDYPAGLCPDCLLQQGLESEDSAGELNVADDQPMTSQQPSEFAPPQPYQIARHFPQLEILELLGHGGMGAVYKARQTKLDRLVALKIIRPESADDPAFAERFNREARTLARLNHPNIVAIHDFGEVTLSQPTVDDTTPRTLFYFLMEYVAGANLRQLIQDGQLQQQQALAIVPQMCEGLQYAHDEGVVHRDIKPENILVDTKGRVKIADFGLAKLATNSPHEFTLTGTHQVMGTPRYMAPEQMTGSHGVDHRADIYSLGVVFYEMLTGEVPMGQFEPPSKKVSVDGRLDEVVLRALASEPRRRFQQASQMKSSVELIASHVQEPHPTSSQSASPPAPAGFSTIAERELRNAWMWIGGHAADAPQRRPTLPVLLVTALSIAGCLMILLPWMDLQITDRAVTTVLEGTQLTTVGNIPAYVRTLHGSDRWPGIATSVAFGVLALLLVTTDSKQRLRMWRAVMMTALAAFAVLHTFLFQLDLQSGRYGPLANQLVKSDSPGTPETLDLASTPLRGIEHRLSYRTGFYGSLSVSLGLLLLSAVGIRHATGQRGRSISAGQDADRAKNPRDMPAQPMTGGHDWVTLTRRQIDDDLLPNVCMVCGLPARQRVIRTFEHTPDWAGVLIFAGILAGIIPGIILGVLLSRKMKVSCPVCSAHRSHWSRLHWTAGAGWLLVILLGAMGYALSFAVGLDGDAKILPSVIGAVIGLIIWLLPLIYLATTRVSVESMTSDEIRLQRVSPAFAKAVRDIVARDAERSAPPRNRTVP